MEHRKTQELADKNGIIILKRSENNGVDSQERQQTGTS
jgi:hypothetical protein